MLIGWIGLGALGVIAFVALIQLHWVTALRRWDVAREGLVRVALSCAVTLRSVPEHHAPESVEEAAMPGPNQMNFELALATLRVMKSHEDGRRAAVKPLANAMDALQQFEMDHPAPEPPWTERWLHISKLI